MESFNNNQEKNIGRSLSWQSQYILFEELSNDFKFFKDELQFFHNLIGNYLIWLNENDNLEEIRVLIKDLNALDDRCNILTDSIRAQLIALEELSNDFYKGNILLLEKENDDVILNAKEFKKHYRALKRNIYQLSKSLFNSKKVK